MSESPKRVVYQFRVVLVGISPLVWRRLLVRSDTTIADFHHILQIAFDWSDNHLHQFLIHGKRCGESRSGGICVLFTANDAYMRDFNLVVPEDCVASNDRAENRHALEMMRRLLKADTRPSAKLDLEELKREATRAHASQPEPEAPMFAKRG